jgi:hypothetical protein
MGISSQGLLPAEAIGEQGAIFSFMFVWLQADRLNADKVINMAVMKDFMF